MALVASVGAVVAAGGASAAAERFTASLSPPPAGLEAGQAWTATLTVRDDGRPVRARAVVHARGGSGTKTFRATLRQPGAFSVRIVLGAGRWRLSASLARRTVPLRSVLVRPRIPPPLRLTDPFDVVVAPDGSLLVTDAGHRVLRAGRDGALSTAAGTGRDGFSGDGGAARTAAVGFPIEVALHPRGGFAVITRGRIRFVDPGGTIRTIAGTGAEGFAGDGGPATAAQLDSPTGIAYDAAGNLYVAEIRNRIRRIDAATGTISTLAAGAFDQPHGLAVSGGTLFVADTVGGRVRRIDLATGAVTTAVGGRALPVDVAVGADGSVYVAEFGANRISRIDAQGAVATFAGNGLAGTTGDGGPAAQASLNGPSGVAIAPDGTVFVCERNARRIRAIDAAGTITTLVGPR